MALSVTQNSNSQDPDPGTVERMLLRIKGGSESVIGDLLESYRRYLLGLANREIGADLKQKVAPSDMVQETLIDAHEHLGNFDGSREVELRAWLRQMLEFRISNHVRKFRNTQKRNVSREIPLDDGYSGDQLHETLTDSSPQPGRHIERSEEQDMLEAAMKQLGNEDREILWLRNRCDLSFNDIAHRLAISPEAARARWVRALKRLKSKLNGHV